MGSLVGKHVMITSGPTRGYIDAVRYISNTSTGKLGAMIATELLKSGACVTFIYGIGSSIPDIALLDKDCARRLMLIEVETIDDLASTTQEKLKDNSFDVIVHAMAVIDYTPEARSNGKISFKQRYLRSNFCEGAQDPNDRACACACYHLA